MNISGILVKALPKNIEKVIEMIKVTDGCEYHLHDDLGRIIVTIEGENTEDEIKKLKKLQKFEYVISADMMYAYSEDELEELKQSTESNNELPEWLNNPEAMAEDIKYNGDLTKKI